MIFVLVMFKLIDHLTFIINLVAFSYVNKVGVSNDHFWKGLVTKSWNIFQKQRGNVLSDSNRNYYVISYPISKSRRSQN